MPKPPKKNKSLTHKSPPTEQTQSIQYNLFTQFFGEDKKLSNTIELWDGVPKYFVSKQAQMKTRDEKGNLPLLKKDFEYKGVRCRVVIQPSVMEQKNGKDMASYPSANEELIEDVLRKFFSDQQHGFHDVKQNESWVRFSLSMIKRELAARGKTRSLDQIKESLDILSGSVLKLFVEDELIYTNPILADVTKVSRKQYLEDPSGYWMARLPALVSKSVNDLTYRQYNYAKMMELKHQPSRWLLKRLSHHYVNASFITPYEVLLSSIIRDSGLLTYGRMRDQVKKFELTLNEIAEEKVITHFDKEERKGKNNKILDVLYKLYAHTGFIKDVKAANARKKKGMETLEHRFT
ncbi:MAG: hypothetical protein ACE5FY_07290 [Nitrospiria bacterium]